MTNEELLEVRGEISFKLWGIAGLIVTFILGFFEGVANPVKCGK